MPLELSSPSKHNAMLGEKVAHPESTNYHGSDDFQRRPVKRVKREPQDDQKPSPTKRTALKLDKEKSRTIADSDDDLDSQDLTYTTNVATDRKTELESALPPIPTDEEAIEEYEATRAGELVEEPDTQTRLKTRRWTRGKSSIYVDAFNLALDTVLEDESHLFSDAEKNVFDDWKGLDYEAQYLYVRLFLRKTSSWHRINKLGYHSDIAHLSAAVFSLQTVKDLPFSEEISHAAPGEAATHRDSTLGTEYSFADRSEDMITTLEEASSLLLLDELKAIAKEAKVQGKNKSELLRALRRSSSKQSGLGFLKRSETEESVTSIDSLPDQDSGTSTPLRGENRDTHFVTKILSETGPCIRLSLAVLKLFERVHLVFYRSTEWTEKSLTAIILARISRWNFPEYLVSRSANIFPSRALLLEYEASVRTQFRIDNILEFNGTVTTETLQTVLDIFEEVYPRWQILLKEEQHKEDSIYSTGEGAYLRRLSPAWVYTRIVHKGAFVMGRFKHHLREHCILSELLAQKLFHTARRGDWYQRKALLEEHYMGALTDPDTRSPEAQKKRWKQIALHTCDQGLQDPLTHLIYHHDLQKRVVKLERALKVPKRAQHDFGHVRLAKPIERTFHGIQVVKSNPSPGGRKGGKTMWLDPALPEGIEGIASVEAMCLSRYRSQGWRGYHSEGSIVRTVFAALFNDIIFTYVPNVFQTPYQTCPLDLHTDTFFPARISEINARLNEIGNGLAEAVARRFYEEHEEKKTCVVGMKWDFRKDDILSVLRAWNPGGLATVMKVLAQEYGARGGGVPDLFLWREFDPKTLRTIRYAHVDEAGDEAALEETQIKAEIDGVFQSAEVPTLVAEEDESESLDEAERARRSAIIASGCTGEVRFAEVKSENDRLSDTQRMWIDVLTGAGIGVELCHAAAEKVMEM